MASQKLVSNAASAPTKSPRVRRKTLADIKTGEQLLAQSLNRKFEPATFVDKLGDLYTVEFMDGRRASLGGTKLRLLSQPRKSSENLDISKSSQLSELDDVNASKLPIPEPILSSGIDRQLLFEENTINPENTLKPENILKPVNAFTFENATIFADYYKYKEPSTDFINYKENHFFNHVSRDQDNHFEALKKANVATVDCPCGIDASCFSETVECSKCNKHQHLFCLGMVEDPFLCYRCLKQHFCFDDILFYNYYMNQHGMFPDKNLNKLCSLTPQKSNLYRKVNGLCQSYSPNITPEELKDLTDEAVELFNLAH